MALSRVGGSSAAANSIAIPTHQAGDLIVIFAYRDGSTTPPTKPTASGTVPSFTTVDGPTGANACAAICAWAIASGTTDTSGTWTGATGISVEVWRGASPSTPIGGHAQSGASVANGGNIAIPAITLTDPSGNSAILAFAGWQNVTAWNAAPAGYTQRSQVSTECEALSKNTTTTAPAFNVSGTASATGGTRTEQLEIIADLGNRVSQVAVEVLYSTSAAQARVSQIAVEVLVASWPRLPFIASHTTLYPFSMVGTVTVPFIGSHTAVYSPTVAGILPVPFISSATALYAPALAAPGSEVDVPFIASKTHAWSIFSIFDPNWVGVGPGNGGEKYAIRLAPNGTTVTATLAADMTADDTAFTVTGDGSFPTDHPFIVTIDDEQIYVIQISAGHYHVLDRARGNTTKATHTTGADVSWGDSYDMALTAKDDIAHAFTAAINDTPSYTYNGFLICFDSSQAYLAGDRYPMHVGEVLGVFDAGAGTGGTNRCDSSQPNAVHTATGASDICPAALSNPAMITSDIAIGDVAVVRFTNPEASVLDLGPRSVSLQSWFGLKRVDSSDADVTLTDPTGYVVDTIPSGSGPGPFTGSVNGEWGEPIPLIPGIAPDASDAFPLEAPIPTPNDVAFTTVTLPGTDRYFTYGSAGGGFDEKGWPMCCLAVRQGNRRIPAWESWDWHDFAYVYTGFGVDDTFAQLLINRNGIKFDSVPEVELPGPQDIDGPDAVWDDPTYYVGASWYIVLFGGPYIVFGPVIGGHTGGLGGSGGGGGGYAPGVTFPPGGGTIITVPPIIEGGGGGGIGGQTGGGLFEAASV